MRKKYLRELGEYLRELVANLGEGARKVVKWSKSRPVKRDKDNCRIETAANWSEYREPV